MRVRLSAGAFQRARASWPRQCCGCGREPTTTYPAYLRKSPVAALATAASIVSQSVSQINRWPR